MRSQAELRQQLRHLQSIGGFHRTAQRSGSGAPTRLGTQRWGHLEIIEQSVGELGVVYQAWTPSSTVSGLKILRPSRETAEQPAGGPATAAEAFRHSTPPGATGIISEARLLAKIGIPNVVTVFGAGEEDGTVRNLDGADRGGDSLAPGAKTRAARRERNDFLRPRPSRRPGGDSRRRNPASRHSRLKRHAGHRGTDCPDGLRPGEGGSELRWTRRGTSRREAALYARPGEAAGRRGPRSSPTCTASGSSSITCNGRHPFEAPASLSWWPRTSGARAPTCGTGALTYRVPLWKQSRGCCSRSAERYHSAGEMDLALGVKTAPRLPPFRAKARAGRIRLPKMGWRRMAWFSALPFLIAAGLWWISRSVHNRGALYRGLPGGGQVSLISHDGVRPMSTSSSDRGRSGISTSTSSGRGRYSGSMPILFSGGNPRREELIGVDACSARTDGGGGGRDPDLPRSGRRCAHRTTPSCEMSET